MMKINEIFGPTIQGEGIFAGVPSIFVRLNFCNLRCCFGKNFNGTYNSICDTPYTSHNPENSNEWEIPQLAKHISDELEKIGGASGENSHIVITGGEPMIQQNELIELIKQLEKDSIFNTITIETNGTIIPDNKLTNLTQVFWSISPKLSTSCCFEGTNIPESLREHHRVTRINIPALAKICHTGQFQLKFVWSGSDCEHEIISLCADIKETLIREYGYKETDAHDLVFDNVLIMPEGTTNEQISKSAQEAVDVCIRNGWRFCDRLHIRVWGDKRAV